MERRDFIKATAAAVVLVASKGSTAFAEEETSYFMLTHKDNPTPLEQKHVPGISTPTEVKAGTWFDVKVKIGFMMEHPSTPEHWITFIRLRVDGVDVATVDYPRGGILSPETVFRIKLEKSSVIDAIENCNIHGTWISQPVKVAVT